MRQSGFSWEAEAQSRTENTSMSRFKLTSEKVHGVHPCWLTMDPHGCSYYAMNEEWACRSPVLEHEATHEAHRGTFYKLLDLRKGELRIINPFLGFVLLV
jgi:hypothetical protein